MLFSILGKLSSLLELFQAREVMLKGLRLVLPSRIAIRPHGICLTQTIPLPVQKDCKNIRILATVVVYEVIAQLLDIRAPKLRTGQVSASCPSPSHIVK